ncbi:HlyD family efflux transporter periplasmic adaptor subunit [Sinirhodobacter populi]|uniref:HlyD family efflux transporter periplasmic adaptor subunit n=1 Tax=Paenirhodobacter populi TaxID=2306993 RepID=A0A443KFK6_9RHOB|nr:HlyD family efflux transporter periplasmic adaptor subunit [Sinirhodobacter populi]RWR31526.1 HlyD family efflux transporter periplasmic adaptor subunit [Sinirhodobacter populi]
MTSRRKWVAGGAVAAAAALGAWFWLNTDPQSLPAGITGSNGRLEAVDIDIAAQTGGRLKDVFVAEGDFVEAGQILAQMDTTRLEAQKLEAEAQIRRAEIAIDTANSLVTQREAEREASAANVELLEAELDAAERRLVRSEALARASTVSQQVLDDDRASERKARAALSSAKASLAASEAAIGAARAQIIDAEAAVAAAKAALGSIAAEIADATLTAPRDGRVQYRLAQPGEVLGSGGRVINMIDVTDVYMNIFLPTELAGRIAIGTEVRLVMDVAPGAVIPATVSFVSDVAQFTPRSVETEEERLKLTFRVRAKIAPELLVQHIRQVKTGLPGMAYVRVDPAAEWPGFLQQGLVAP